MTQLPRVLVVNLDTSIDRYRRIADDLAQAGVPHQRVPAVPGTYLPAFALRKFVMGGNTADKFPGTFGCFMSHMRAWEIAATAAEERTLILEDDARLMPDFRAGLVEPGPEAAELVFVNERMCVHLKDSSPGEARYATFQDAIALRKLGISQPGGDGYILSRAGAARLLQAAATVPLGRHVDLFLCARSLTSDTLGCIRGGKDVATQLKHAGKIATAEDVLVSYCRTAPLVFVDKRFRSERLDADQA
jgi:GR25 family glycosyltransferase involved in LPS biosynthesis